MSRPLLFTAALLCLPSPSRATEWDDLRAQYQFCTVAGGLGAANGDLNPNEWNNAEGLSALAAELSEPHFVMEDIDGRIFVADKNAHSIRRIDSDGTIHTVAGMNLGEVAGGGTNAGYNGDGPARQCLLNGPQIAYTMPDGTFYIGDSINRRVRRVDTGGNLVTVINDPDILSRGLWVRRDHQIIYYCTINATSTASWLKRWTPANGSGPGDIVAAGFIEAGNIDLDSAGNIYVTDRTLSGVYRVPPDYGGGTITNSLRVAGLGNSSVADSDSASNGQFATAVGMRGARGIAFHPLGGYFVATHRGGDIWYVDNAGRAWMFVQGDNGNTHAGSSQPVPTAGLIMSEPRSISVGLSGNITFACNDAGFVRIVRNILPLPVAPAWLGSAPQPGGLRLRWESDATRWYFLEQSSGLDSSAWSPLATLPGAAVEMEFVDPGALSVPRRFYRVRSFRPWPN